MTEITHPPGWWLASDGHWYAPHLHPDATRVTPPAATPPQEAGVGSWPSGGPRPSFPTFAPLDRSPQATSPYPTYPTHPAYAPWPGADVPPGYGYPSVPQSTNGLAIASLVLSIVTVVGLGSIAGIVMGFTSRRQIARSGGAQKGGGLALAGIIVGFVTLSLVLLAIAIPTFLGVQRAGHATALSRLPPAPIALGTPVQGGTGAPVVWAPKLQQVDTTVAPVPGGVDLSIGVPHEAEFVGAPVDQGYPSIQESASVAVTTGPTADGIGLGCVTPGQDQQLAFFVHSSGLWDIVHFTADATTIVDQGVSPSIHGAGANDVTIACGGVATQPGTTRVGFEVNGTPLATDLVALSSAEWFPTIQLCSCSGPDTGRYLDLRYYATAGTAGTST